MIIRALAPILTLILLGLMLREVSLRPTAADAIPFHAAAAASIKGIPLDIGDWKGRDQPLPTSATALLRPNATLSRTFVNAKTSERVTLLIVQCRDARDMAGHYPPICYPNSGWLMQGEPSPIRLPFEQQGIEAVRYQFKKANFDRDDHAIIYGFFAIPGPGYKPDMPSIRKIAADYTSRGFGAAQLQIVFNTTVPQAREEEIVTEMLASIAPTVKLLADAAWRKAKS